MNFSSPRFFYMHVFCSDLYASAAFFRLARTGACWGGGRGRGVGVSTVRGGGGVAAGRWRGREGGTRSRAAGWAGRLALGARPWPRLAYGREVRGSVGGIPRVGGLAIVSVRRGLRVAGWAFARRWVGVRGSVGGCSRIGRSNRFSSLVHDLPSGTSSWQSGHSGHDFQRDFYLNRGPGPGAIAAF